MVKWYGSFANTMRGYGTAGPPRLFKRRLPGARPPLAVLVDECDDAFLPGAEKLILYRLRVAQGGDNLLDFLLIYRGGFVRPK